MLGDAGDVLEGLCKGAVPAGLLLVLLPAAALLLLSRAAPAQAAHEFPAMRAAQFDIHGQQHGSRNAIVNAEARSGDADGLSRRCVLLRLSELSLHTLRHALAQAAAAIVILLPPDLGSLPGDALERLREVEPELLMMETAVPVYLAQEDEELLSIHEQLHAASTALQHASAAQVMLSTATANGFQMVASGGQSKALPDWPIASIEGRLPGMGGDDLPTIVIVAHYDSLGLAPWLSFGADSNGSGVAALLELARLFSKLYTHKRTHAAYNLLFFLSGGGKFGYQGTKRWLEDNLDHTDASWLQDSVAFVLCLDTLGSGDSLHLHVSKPPKEGTPPYAFLKELEYVAASQHPSLRFSMLHKKINLAEETLAWEHERFGIRRLPAFTASRLDTHRRPERTTIADVGSQVDITKLSRNVKILGEALARYIYNLTGKGTTGEFEVFSEQLRLQEEQMGAMLDWLASQPRAAPLVGPDHALVTTLEHHMGRYLKDVRTHNVRADKREPEFLFYDQLKQTMNAYRVKPAIFDLILAVGIAAYLGVVYLAIQNFGLLYETMRRLNAKPKLQ
uniref:Nicalin n=1 Tax=Petromyzon marinus TaxID=7757 RepID=A0AAJ7U8E0_PETMA|nr:nicalin [Petromyzon marinus]